MRTKDYVLGIILFITIIAAIATHFSDHVQVDEPNPLNLRKVFKSNKDTPMNIEVKSPPLRWPLDQTIVDLFYIKPTIIEVPPAAKPVAQIIAPAPLPMAPPLPFVYLGKMIEDGKVIVYVSKAGTNYVLRGGEIIDGMYKVKSIDGQQVVFQFIPLTIEQSLAIRGGN